MIWSFRFLKDVAGAMIAILGVVLASNGGIENLGFGFLAIMLGTITIFYKK